MNDVKLLHTKCCFFQFFNSPVALKNKKIVRPPQEKVEMTPWYYYSIDQLIDCKAIAICESIIKNLSG